MRPREIISIIAFAMAAIGVTAVLFLPAVQTDCRGRRLNRPPPETRTEPMNEGQKNSP
jgi:hypothetical protein